MIFKDLKKGYPVYLLDRNTMEYKKGTVDNVSLPHVDAKAGGAMSMVVDLTIEVDKKQTTYVMVAESETAYPNGKVISTELPHIKREVESMRLQAEQALAQVEHQREMLEKCNKLMAELDPAQKEKQANEARFSKLEENMNSIMDMLKKLTD